ncbi:DUF2000 domain-containing protein [Pseudodonghicola xiamenensis]|uniref:DUF2000 domain-containing protein n=1 Tax=Pseudodonghicola xiamenensis TaxID=337702 RepID=A0A8J3MCT1_9RHOB|nr:DUF2000 domain-containing protein [Pseudodonghicola xiamenensis]GHG88256.1 hypothetical protein GCM10010961_17170 [Pseudodonghicola xiamenensis]
MSVKPVIILAETLPLGLKANFAAVLGMSLGQRHPELVGADTPTQDQEIVPGITTVALPILSAPAETLGTLYEAAAELPVRLAYMEAAFRARDYTDYTARIAAAPLADHAPQAILLAGPRKAVDRICGRLPLLR